ncbi:MAG: YnbE family lipoprotein [Nitrospira sp.]|nr:YnbE family lipoprotein [Nitrospira sp.]MBX3333566.1 YnbE family lipoprotein [Nitrospira sp.]MDR4463881.1 YnbE family lipoprotein [Nitrospira sp.]MDR4468087.1 YnbE family lipoprotein [Nitrospira sp.]
MQSRVMLFSVEMLLSGALLISLGACSPRVEVAPSDKPITINLNVKIDHEIRLKVDKELDDVISKDSGLF